MTGSFYKRFMALALILTITCVTMPVSAADLHKTKPILGSVNAVGRVEVRGVSITDENTLFSGDRIRSLDKAYAKILLTNGSKLELAEKTDININPDGKTIQIAMAAGTMGFTSLGSSLRINVQPFEVLGIVGASGKVTVRADAATVHALKGSLTVRNLKTRESFVVSAGQDRLFGLDGTKRVSLGEIASNMPGPIPTGAPVPAPQAGGQTSGGGWAMDKGGWLAVIAGAAAAGILITTLALTMGNKDDIDAIGSKIDGLGNQISSGQGATQAGLAAIQKALQLSQTAAAVQNTSSQVGTAANQAAAAINASNLTAQQKAAFAAQAAQIATQASQASQTAATLQAQISTLQALISSSGTATAAQQTQLTTFQTQLNAAVNQLNTANGQLQNLINTANQQGARIPNAPINPVPGVSASVPA